MSEWLPGVQQPIFQGRNLTEVTGPRYERRPSKIAKRAGFRSITDMTERAPDLIELRKQTLSLSVCLAGWMCLCGQCVGRTLGVGKFVSCRLFALV